MLESCISSRNMFPLQDSNDLRFPPSNLEQDLDVDHVTSNIITKNTKKRQRRSKSVYEETNDSKVRKIMHRDVERQRRQEMSSLYASLRSLLPLEYIKGKRSVSDHMHEAVKYIENMERNIKELKIRRDKIKKLSNSFGSGISNSAINLPKLVTINYCVDSSVEILISCGLKEEEGFHLSTVLTELLLTGLTIVSCNYTKANGRFIYSIKSEVNDLAYINLPGLQQRLANVINFG